MTQQVIALYLSIEDFLGSKQKRIDDGYLIRCMTNIYPQLGFLVVWEKEKSPIVAIEEQATSKLSIK